MSRTKLFYVYVKTDSQNALFDIGLTENILENGLLSSFGKNKNMACGKLVYYECGYDYAYAKQRCALIRELSPSKRRAIIQRSNPLWIDLSQLWMPEKFR